MPRIGIAPLRRHAGRVGVLFLGLLTLSCASSRQLTRKSEESLKVGQTSHAYEWARRALDKDPRNDVARANMTAAATPMSADWKQRVRSLAASDSLQGADAALEFGRFRAELARYQVVLPFDRAYHDDEARILGAAASHAYGAALTCLTGHQPKCAYRHFLVAGRYVPGFRDISVRIPRTYDLALTRVAVLPFANETEVAGLSKEMTDRMYGELDDRLNPREFQFTRLIDPEEVYGRMTVAQLSRIDRDQAIQIGRQVGAQLVVWGRYSGFNANSSTGLYHQTIYRHVVDPDPSAKDRDRYEESDFTAITRQRDVKVHYEFEVVDTDNEETLARSGDDVHAVANTVYSLFQARGDCDTYCLLPPELRQSNPTRAAELDKQWEASFGNWTLSKLLLKARESRGRTRYRPEYRAEFLNASYIFPVFLDDLPAPDDMAFMALDGTWKPLYQALRDLDDRDPAPTQRVTSSGR